MEFTGENPMIEPKENPTELEVPIEKLLPTEVVQAANLDYDDDDCVICYQTLYRPVKTDCKHAACESCMLHWALMAMDSATGESDLPSNLGIEIDGIKFKCPTCRTYTEARFDNEFNEILKGKYPEEYISRAKEENNNSTGEELEDEFAVQSMILMFGNSHRKVPPTISPHSGKIREHEWTFFVKPSRQDLIEQVHVILHPSFREGRLVTLKQPPFSTTQNGWGYFTVFAGVQLQEGYQWVGEERAVDTDTAQGRVKDRLPIEWLLDFRSNGGQRNRIVKFQKVKKEEQELAEEEDDLGALADLMSETEIAELREVRRLKAAARKAEGTQSQ